MLMRKKYQRLKTGKLCLQGAGQATVVVFYSVWPIGCAVTVVGVFSFCYKPV